MRIIKPATVQAYWQKHAGTQASLKAWLRTAQAASWANITEIRKTYPHADAAKVASGAIVTIFNIKGNEYRLITAIHYNRKWVFIRDFMTHAEYSKGNWKERH
jgi:mRNA interferase HigB